MALMRFYDEGTTTSNSNRQSKEPGRCSSPKIINADGDNDSLMFDIDEDLTLDTQSRTRRVVSPPRSFPISANPVTLNVSKADSLASSTSSSLHGSQTPARSSSPDEVEPSMNDITLSDDGPSAREIILQPIRTGPLPIPREYQPLYPLFQPAGAEKLWYLGFLDP
jgi:hypothetical protein